MKTVSFTRMDQGTVEDYALVERKHEEHKQAHLAGCVLDLLFKMKGPKLGYRVDRHEHSLQTATRAERDGADEETVVCALLHDIGDVIAPDNHSELAAAVLRPYISERNHWIVRHHGLFQGYYYFDKVGLDRDARDRFKGHEHYDACERFCRDWDQTSFDPGYDSLPLKHFEPMVRRLFARPPKGFEL